MPKRRKAKKKKVPMKTFPPTSGSVPLSALMVSETEDYSAKLPDLQATAIGYEYPPAAISHISESEGLPSSFLVETHSDINISEDIESPDMSPFTSDEEEVPLTNQHLQTATYSSHRRVLLSKSIRANCSHSE